MSHIAQADSFAKWARYMIFFGVTIAVIFLLMMAFSGMLWGSIIDTQGATMLGTFIGGTVGATWALAGVFLYYAALMYQKEELKETRESRDDLKRAYDDQRHSYDKQIQIYDFNKFQTFALSMIESFRELRSNLREVHLSDRMLIIPNPPYLRILNLLNETTIDKPIDINAYKELSHKDILYPLYTEFCETFYILVHKAIKNWKESGDEEYLSYESLLIRSLTDEELLIIFYYGLLPKQSLFLREYFKMGKEWSYRMNTQIRIERPNFYSAWKTLCEEKD